MSHDYRPTVLGTYVRDGVPCGVIEDWEADWDDGQTVFNFVNPPSGRHAARRYQHLHPGPVMHPTGPESAGDAG